mgnify:CR=1 FL=1
MLRINPYSSFFRGLQDIPNLDEYNIFLESNPAVDKKLYNKPTISQVGGIWTESTGPQETTSRHIQVYSINGASQVVKHYYGCYDPMQYPLIFPNGEPGWHPGIEKLERSYFSSSAGQTCHGERITSAHMFMTVEEIIEAENAGILLFIYLISISSRVYVYEIRHIYNSF